MQRRTSAYTGGAQRYSPYQGQGRAADQPGQQLPNPYADPFSNPLLASQLFAAYSNFPPPMAVPGMAAAGGAAAPTPLPEGAMKVSKETDVKGLAGKIAHKCREGDAPDVVARGAAINNAVKGIAIACSFLKDSGISLSVSPYHCNDGDNTTGRTVIFKLTKTALEPEPVPAMTLKVAKNSVPSKVAGYLASKIRSNFGKTIAMQSVGGEAAEHAVNTLVLARRYLKMDNKTVGAGAAMDFTFTPGFATIVLGDKSTSALQFFISVCP